MKKIEKKLIFVMLIIFTSCTNEGNSYEPIGPKSFLSEIRPTFFDHLNFNSQNSINQIPQFLSEFKETYEDLKTKYDSGEYSSESDLNNFRIAGMYYSFALTAITRAYLDDFIEFDDIVGDSENGLFSELSIDEVNFQQEELKSMMKISEKTARFAMLVNNFNDKTYGTFLVSRQIRGRVNSSVNFNNPQVQDSVINYIDSNINDYELYKNWNTLMSQLSLTNYSDSLNTFKNPRMNVVLTNLNDKLTIGSIPDLNGRFAEILGPIFRFDSNMKKIDWLLNYNDIANYEEINELNEHIQILQELKDYVFETKQFLFNDWSYTNTLEERFSKFEELKNLINQIDIDPNYQEEIELTSFFKTKNFLQAYQCFNCHTSPSSY
jgi:hypothetical protein